MDRFQETANKLVEGWKLKTEPEYREFVCGKCLKKVRKVWHIWLNNKKWKTEVHLCKKCGKEYGLCLKR